MRSSMNGKKIKDHTDFRLRVAEQAPGDKVRLKIFREGKIINLTVDLTEHPGERPPQKLSEKETKQLGIKVTNLTPERARRYGFEEDEYGVIVVDVKQSSEAYRKGIRKGDLITSINRTRVENVRDYDKIVDRIKSGDILLFRLKKRVGNSISNYYITIRVSE